MRSSWGPFIISLWYDEQTMSSRDQNKKDKDVKKQALNIGI